MDKGKLKRSVGKRVKYIRESKGLTQEELSNKGIDLRYLQRIEAGTANITLDTVERLARYLKIKPIELFV